MSDTLEQQQRIDKEIQEELLSGETVLWSGQPLRSVIFHSSDWYAIPFSLLWGGFAIFWESGVTGHFGFADPKEGFSLFMALWGIPFIVIGQYMIWGRFPYTAWKKGRTYYAVTTRRILVVTSGATRKVVSGYLRTLDNVSLTTRQDGIGTLEFSPEPERSNSFWNSRRGRGGPQLDDLCICSKARQESVQQSLPLAKRVHKSVRVTAKFRTARLGMRIPELELA